MNRLGRECERTAADRCLKVVFGGKKEIDNISRAHLHLCSLRRFSQILFDVTNRLRDFFFIFALTLSTGVRGPSEGAVLEVLSVM